MGRTIVIFSALYAPSMGGVEQYSERLAIELVREGHRVVVVTSDIAGRGPAELTDEGVMLIRMPCKPLAGGRFPLLVPGSAQRTLLRRLEDLRPDGVVVQTRFYPLSLVGMDYARRMGVRAVLIDHGSSYLGFGDARIDWLVRLYERTITQVGRRYPLDCYGVSVKSAQWLGTFGIEARGVLHNAIDAQALRECASQRDLRAECGVGPDALVAAFTGRLVVDKGTRVMLDAARSLADEGRDIHVLVAGEGPERAAMETAALPNVHVLGRLTREDVSALLQTTDVFVLPSKTEGLPTSLLEASACGRASVATDVGGVREILPQEAHDLVMPSMDARLLAQRLVWCDDHRGDLARLGECCRTWVEREFSWQHTAHDVLRACEEAQLRGVY